MIGNNDRQTIRENAPPPPSAAPKANAPATPSNVDITTFRANYGGYFLLVAVAHVALVRSKLSRWERPSAMQPTTEMEH